MPLEGGVVHIEGDIALVEHTTEVLWGAAEKTAMEAREWFGSQRRLAGLLNHGTVIGCTKTNAPSNTDAEA